MDILAHCEISHSEQARIAAQALLDAADRMEGTRVPTEEECEKYHLEIAYCDVWTTLKQLNAKAARHGWDAAKFARDVWSNLYADDFEVWRTAPLFTTRAESNA